MPPSLVASALADPPALAARERGRQVELRQRLCVPTDAPRPLQELSISVVSSQPGLAAHALTLTTSSPSLNLLVMEHFEVMIHSAQVTHRFFQLPLIALKKRAALGVVRVYEVHWCWEGS